MVPAALLAFFLPTAAQAASSASQDLPRLFEQWTERVCVQAKPRCAEARAIAAAGLAVLREARVCAAQGCRPVKLVELDDRSYALSKRAAAVLELVADPGRAQAGLYEELGKALGQAESRDPETWAIAASGRDEREAAQIAHQSCQQALSAACRRWDGVFAGARAARTQALACLGPSPCSFDRVDAAAVKAQAAFEAYFGPAGAAPVAAAPLGRYAFDQYRLAFIVLGRYADTARLRLARDLDAFEKKVDAAQANKWMDIRGFGEEARRLTDEYREASIAADRLAAASDSGEPRLVLNAAASRLAGLRGRVKAIQQARALAKLDSPLGELQAAVGGVSVERRNGKSATSLVNAVSRPTILDERTVPQPDWAGHWAPTIQPSAWKIPAVLAALSPDPVTRADGLHRLHRTRTVGNPAFYATYWLPQKERDTCGLVAQIQVLRARGLLPIEQPPSQQEQQLAAYARAKGYLKAGTPRRLIGEILIEKGFTVSKYARGGWPMLETFVRRGALLEASVDASVLWHGGPPRGWSHAILITGAEIALSDGELLGVYVNDGSHPLHGGGIFVSAERIRRALEGDFIVIR